MGEGPVTQAEVKRRAPSWKLAPPHDRLTQGLAVSGFHKLPAGEALFLSCPEASADPGGRGGWLRTLLAVAPISDSDGPDPRAAAIAFTFTGLQRLGLSGQALASFSAPFREGMYQEDRLRRLGDREDGAWKETVIRGGPRWSGNIPARSFRHDNPDAGQLLVNRPECPDEETVTTPLTVHALLLLYDETVEKVRAWAEEVEARLSPHAVAIAHRLALDLQLDENEIGREHFGFADGLSQPMPYDADADEGGPAEIGAVTVEGRPAKRDEWHGVPLGEFLFGHTNGHHEKAPGPLLPLGELGVPPTMEVPGNAPEGFFDFGVGGSYLVVRELRQNVPAFWRSMEEGARRIRDGDPALARVDAAWISERVIGRSIDGHLLCPGGYLSVNEFNRPRNDFGFIHTDPHGLGCPPGSHVRRGNPRDGLAPEPASAKTLLAAANNHRILRRGRKYGPKADPAALDDAERGLLFMCLNTDIARQFEFIQQTWILNRNFATLFDEVDPLIGPKGSFTLREHPLRRIVEVETFVQMAGGEYFFLPSMAALEILARP